ncbi:hypothetical protein P4L24_25215 [Bacillus cereus]|uniref:hypothetical protein n=1 Tax=Bacillus thuringiensis TaxID=1428 RepID=UPI0026E37F88|nr:hypothetical protein [Bacillus thuringiensis]MDO6628649.1 hypothetical protein [Bacillus thuringiensis]MDO6659226.1 hypothetical protein [Bacillus thuringiensis]MDO6698808.1 hypothetical protein [Bacillus thuringiensis]MEC0031149.1 hypothetical protein [Bacillus cereus]
MSTKPKKDKTAGEQILFQSNKSDLDIIKWYNNQDNFAKAFRYLVRKHIETYGYVDTKYIIMQEELRKAGMEIPDVAPVAPTPQPVVEEAPVTPTPQPVNTPVETEVTVEEQEAVVEEVAEEVVVEQEKQSVSDIDVPEIIKNKHKQMVGTPIAQPTKKVEKKVEEKKVESSAPVMPSIGDL